MRQNINTTVNITAMKFGRDMRLMPYRMEWASKSYYFVNGGIQVTSRKSNITHRIFTMSDGVSTFQLSHASGRWTLIGTY